MEQSCRYLDAIHFGIVLLLNIMKSDGSGEINSRYSVPPKWISVVQAGG